MDPMTPAEFEHHAASEQFEDYEQYLDHYKAREQSRAAASASRMSDDSYYVMLLCFGFVLYVVLDEVDPFYMTFR
jgi:hypothetical protein